MLGDISILELFRCFVRCSVITNGRELRKDVSKSVLKTMALRKEIRSINPSEDEVASTSDGLIELCCACHQESTGKTKDDWICCTE